MVTIHPRAGPIRRTKFGSCSKDLASALLEPLTPLSSSAAFKKIAHHGSPRCPQWPRAIYLSIAGPRFSGNSLVPISFVAHLNHGGGTRAVIRPPRYMRRRHKEEG